MDILEKVGGTVSAKAKEAADKAKVMAEIMKLKSQISTCEEVMRKNYLEIGKQYFEEYGDVQDAPYEKNCRAISDARKGVDALQARIDELRCGI